MKTIGLREARFDVPTINEFEQLVLLALARARDEGYGIQVRRIIQQRGARRASLAAVYAALARLEERGLVSSRIEPPTGRRGGRATKHFTLTTAGTAALTDARAVMARMWDGLELGGFREAR